MQTPLAVLKNHRVVGAGLGGRGNCRVLPSGQLNTQTYSNGELGEPFWNPSGGPGPIFRPCNTASRPCELSFSGAHMLSPPFFFSYRASFTFYRRQSFRVNTKLDLPRRVHPIGIDYRDCGRTGIHLLHVGPHVVRRRSSAVHIITVCRHHVRLCRREGPVGAVGVLYGAL